MCSYYIIFIIAAITIGIMVYVFARFIYATVCDIQEPPKPIHYVWRNVYPDYKGDWNRGRVTLVYIDPETNNIRGKVVKTEEGLYLATMWNGQHKECMYEQEAIKSVEEYKPRVYK